MVFGTVGLDMVAGPSEILVVCDGQTDPDWIAMDLFSQAEHDEDAQSIFIAWDADYIEAVQRSMEKLLPEMERRDIIRQSLERRGALIEVADQQQAIALINRIAPEHLELSVEDPQAWLPEIRHAGAIFMGATLPKHWVTTVPDQIMCCPPRPQPAFHRRWVSMTSRSAAR